MKKVVIIEGPDNVGKTTLCEYLKQQLPSYPTIHHFGAPTKKGNDALKEQLAIVQKLDRTIEGSGIEIWDRSIIGEAVYGPLFRTKQYDHAIYLGALKAWMQRRRQAVFTVVLYTDGEVFKRMGILPKKNEKEIYQQQQQAATIACKFIDVVSSICVMNTLFINCANYRTFDERNAYIKRRIGNWINGKVYEHRETDNYSHTFFNPHNMIWEPGLGFVKHAYKCQAFDNGKCSIGRDHLGCSQYGEKYERPTSGCGSTKDVNFVFVGEAPGYNGCGKLGIPFYDDVSGNLLQTALDRCGILPTRYYMTNIIKCCPKDNKLDVHVSTTTRPKLECVKKMASEIEDIIEYNGGVRVIALGKVAAAELARLKVDHEMLYHPAYYLRMGRRDDFMKDFSSMMKAHGVHSK